MKILNATLRFICVVHNAVNHILHTALVNVMCVCGGGEGLLNERHELLTKSLRHCMNSVPIISV